MHGSHHILCLPAGAQITRAARVYRRMLGIEDESYRFDVVTVIFNDNSTPQIELLRNFWTEESIRRKRRWTSDPFYFC